MKDMNRVKPVAMANKTVQRLKIQDEIDPLKKYIRGVRNAKILGPQLNDFLLQKDKVMDS